MITGSVALSFYAQPRMTRDIDLVIECEPDDAPRIVDLFRIVTSRRRRFGRR